MTHKIQTAHGAAEGRTELKFVPSAKKAKRCRRYGRKRYVLDIYFTRYFIAPEGVFVTPGAETSCRQSLKDKRVKLRRNTRINK